MNVDHDQSVADNLAQEFDRYVVSNAIPLEQHGEAFQQFLREYGEMPDVTGEETKRAD